MHPQQFVMLRLVELCKVGDVVNLIGAQGHLVTLATSKLVYLTACVQSL